ncbi:YihY/virulence factor BrkB family protein [Streptomyces cinerochromogenes]
MIQEADVREWHHHDVVDPGGHNIAIRPVMIMFFAAITALLFWAAPNVKRKFRWISPGSLMAMVLWLIASAAFAFYVAHLSSYNTTYGKLAAIVIFPVWMWISNLAILLGLEFNAELERARATDSGHPPGEKSYVESPATPADSDKRPPAPKVPVPSTPARRTVPRLRAQTSSRR